MNESRGWGSSCKEMIIMGVQKKKKVQELLDIFHNKVW